MNRGWRILKKVEGEPDVVIYDGADPRNGILLLMGQRAKPDDKIERWLDGKIVDNPTLIAAALNLANISAMMGN